MKSMAPMKAMKAGAKPMSKGGLAQALSDATEIKRKECTNIVEKLAEIATKQVKSVGKFTLPGLCMIKTRRKPATKAGKKRDLRKNANGQGQAGTDSGQGLSCVRTEKAILSFGALTPKLAVRGCTRSESCGIGVGEATLLA